MNPTIEEVSSNSSDRPPPLTTQPRSCSFIITGFGPFRGVPDNPTSVLIRRLQKEKNISNLISSFILETSAEYVREKLDDIYGEVVVVSEKNTTATTSDGSGGTTETIILIHLGVNYRGKHFHLEECAYNDATFRIADERGFQPNRECILENNNETDVTASHEWGECLHTTLDVQKLCNELQKYDDDEVVSVSNDPGRFVCNYAYCLSLDRCNTTNKKCNNWGNKHEMIQQKRPIIHALFIHVPPFSEVPEDRQLNFILKVMQTIEWQLSSSSHHNLSGCGDISASLPNYPYQKLLHRLQSTVVSSQQSQVDTTAIDEEQSTEQSAPPTTSTNNNWDLSNDAQLATLLHEFTSHMIARTHHVACDIRNLQNEVNNVGVNVAMTQTQLMKRSDTIFMEQVVGDDDDAEEEESDSEEVDKTEGGDNNAQKSKIAPENDDNDDVDDSSADIACLELEEQSAIADGMKALNLFFDPKRKVPPITAGSIGSESKSGGGNNNNMIIDAEEDIIGDNCYYYPSAEEDGFNQRPLPFIIGSREFMESSCTSGGGDGERP